MAATWYSSWKQKQKLILGEKHLVKVLCNIGTLIWHLVSFSDHLCIVSVQGLLEFCTAFLAWILTSRKNWEIIMWSTTTLWIIDFWNLAQYIEKFNLILIFYELQTPCIICCFYNSGSLRWFSSATTLLEKAFDVYSESTECQNTTNRSLNHYTVKYCDLYLWETTTWSVLSLSQLFQS